MTEDESKIVDRIRAILRKADESSNDSEAERDTAMRMAQKLLLKHGISMGDVGEINDEAETPEGRRFGDNSTLETDGFQDNWRGTLLSQIAAVYFCKGYFYDQGHGRKRWYVIGRADHVGAALAMFGFVAPQLDRVFNVELSKMGLYQRLARKYALIVGGVPRDMIELPIEQSDAEIAEIGAEHFEAIRYAGGPEAALDDVQRVLGTSRNYAKHVRVHIRKHDVAPAVTSNLGRWRESWFSFAIMTIARRLQEILREEAEGLGNAGTDLVVNERQALTKYMEDIGLDLKKNKGKDRELDPAGAASGRQAGEDADLSPGRKIEDGAREELTA